MFGTKLQNLTRESRDEIAGVVDAATVETLEPSAVAAQIAFRLADAAEHRTVTMCLIDALVARAVEGDKTSVEIVARLFGGRPQDLLFSCFKEATAQQKTRAVGFLRRWGQKGVFAKDVTLEAINAINGVAPSRDASLPAAAAAPDETEKPSFLKAHAVQAVSAAIRDWMTHIEAIPVSEREGLLRSTAALIPAAWSASTSSEVLLLRTAVGLREAVQVAVDPPIGADVAGLPGTTTIYTGTRAGGRLHAEAVENVCKTAAVSYLHALETDVESAVSLDRPYPRKQRNSDAVLHRQGQSAPVVGHGIARFRTWFLNDDEWMVEKDMNRVSLTDCRSIGFRAAPSAVSVELSIAGKRDRER